MADMRSPPLAICSYSLYHSSFPLLSLFFPFPFSFSLLSPSFPHSLPTPFLPPSIFSSFLLSPLPFTPSLPPPSLPSLPPCSRRKGGYQPASNDAELQKNPMYDEHNDNPIEHSTSFSGRYREPPVRSLPGATYETLDTALNQAYGAPLEPRDSFTKDTSFRPQLPPPRNSFSKTLATATHTTTFQPPSSTTTFQPPSSTTTFQPPSSTMTFQPPSSTTTFQPPTTSPVGGMESVSHDGSAPLQLSPGNSFSRTPASAVHTQTFQPSVGSPVGGVKNPVYGASGGHSNTSTTDQYVYVEVEKGKD